MIRRSIRKFAAPLALTALAMGTTLAHAQSVPACDVNDVSPTAEACVGYTAGNTDTPAGTAFIDGVLNSWGFSSWTDASGYNEVKSDDSSTDGFSFSGSTVSFGQTLYGDLVIGLKFGAGGRGQDTGFALYHIDAGTTGLSSFTFTNPGMGGLSHVSQWGGSTGAPPPPPPAVPEPETYALMLAGLVAVGLAARRRKAQAAAEGPALDQAAAA